MIHTTWRVTCNTQVVTHDTKIHDKARDKKGTGGKSDNKLGKMGTDMDGH